MSETNGAVTARFYRHEKVTTPYGSTTVTVLACCHCHREVLEEVAKREQWARVRIETELMTDDRRGWDLESRCFLCAECGKATIGALVRVLTGEITTTTGAE